MLKIDNYRILYQIYESNNSEVYRAIKEDDNQRVILKVLKENYPTPVELTRYKQEYAMTCHLDQDGMIKTYGLEKYHNTLVIFVEDFGGESLAILTKKYQFSIKKLLTISMKIANSLAQIHAANIIHKDINPANIVFNQETNQLKIIDFGLATRLTRENPTLKNPQILEGTLPYISPEQTGRMNRSLDYRTDFYSLGVTFYKLFTGQLPFNSKDDLELIHCHIAHQPVFPSEINSSIPPTLAHIMMKLMAKNAEDRYQSAWGLQADLQNCLNQLLSQNQIEHFILGMQDIPDKFYIPEKLYGREAEIKTLLQSFQTITQSFHTSDGKKLVLVAGYSGIGKSSLVREIYKPITAQKGYFISGKFDQFQRNIPYSAVVQAFRELVKQLLTEPEAILQQWQGEILIALGNNGQIIIDVIPEVELIIGKQPTVIELGANESQNRFNFVLQNFIKVFTKVEHPLALFLDDLQWADGASLKLMELLMNSDAQGLFLIGAYRDNEVFPTHPLILTLDEIAKTGGIIERLVLTPLTLPTVTQLIADALKALPDNVFSLAKLVLAKTGGNPFFLNEFLRSLYTEELLQFNHQSLQWEWDLENIKKQNFTDNVVDLLISKIRKLPTDTQNILKIAATIGNQFDLLLVSAFFSNSLRNIINSLDIAVSENLVIPLDTRENIELAWLSSDIYQLPPYKFVHDRIQQAAYALISEEEKTATHYQIGKLLLQQISPLEREEHIFELVNQLNQGLSLINDKAEIEQLIQLNLVACRKAKASVAYAIASEYVKVGLVLLGDNAWQDQYEITLDFHELGAELAFLSSDLPQMTNFMNAVVQSARSVLDLVKIYLIKIQANASHNKISEALQIGQEILEKFGIIFPLHPTNEDISQLIAINQTLLADKNIEDLVNLPVMQDPEKLAIIEICNCLIPAAFNAGSPLFFLIGTLTVTLSIEYGNAPSSCFSYSTYGMILCNFSLDIENGIKFGELALKILDNLDHNLITVKAAVLTIIGAFIIHRHSHIVNAMPIFRAAYQSALETGNLEYNGYDAYAYCISAFWSGQPLPKVQKETQEYIDQLVTLNQLTGANYCRIYAQSILNLLGYTNNPTVFSGEILQETEILPQLLASNDLVGVYFFYLYKLMLCFLFENIDQAQEYAVTGRQYLNAGVGLLTQGVFYFYDSLIILAQLPINISTDGSNHTLVNTSVNTEAIDRALELVEANQNILSKNWSAYAPMNYQHKINLVAAEKCRVLGQILPAMELYDLAIAQAKKHEYIQEVAIAYELASKFYLSLGRELIARVYMQESSYFYQLWGATAKVKYLEEKYWQLFTLQSHNFINSISSGIKNKITTYTSGSHKSGDNLDLATVIKASQVISGQIVLDKLLVSLLQIIMENTGAQLGYLILQKAGKLLIEASGVVNDYSKITALQSLPVENHLPVSLINYVARLKEEVILNHATATGNFVNDPYILNNQPLSILCYPLLNQRQLIGMIYLENNLITGAFTADRIELLQLLAGQAAVSVANAILYGEIEDYARTLEQKVSDRTAELQAANQQLLRLANLDGLTQIPNRRRFDDYLGIEWQRHLREQNPLALILIDIDYFKRYNDYYGHQGGDSCLIQVAQNIAKVPQRATDLVARYGGEEFVVILPNTSGENALIVAENIRRAIALLQIPHANSQVSDYVTLSLGVASLIPLADSSPENLIAQADQALYAAKERGRNQAVFLE